LEVKINNTEQDGQYLEYNLLGGVLDFYFFDGPSPVEASQQYSQIVGLPVMMPYWGFGFHQCRYGYRDVYQVAEVVYNYSRAGIPLEVMWTDIDYMFQRWIFTLDPDNYPLAKVRELVDYLHTHQQQYVVMVCTRLASHSPICYADLAHRSTQQLRLPRTIVPIRPPLSRTLPCVMKTGLFSVE
jgi:alpha-glucosidase